MKKQRQKLLLAIVAFALTFYWVEFSPWSSKMVAEFNNGYGTFDMKQYNMEKVSQVLSTMEESGFSAYYRYLIGDYLFLLAFGALQIVITASVCKRGKGIYLKRAAIAAAIARGGFDLVENTMLLLILQGYPKISKWQITISSVATRMKLLCIPLWIVLVLIGYVLSKRKDGRRMQEW